MPSVSTTVTEDDTLAPFVPPRKKVSEGHRKQRMVRTLDSEVYHQRHHVGVIGEPYMTPFLLFNLLMREFDCPLATCEEVNSIIQRFESVRQSFFATSKASKKRIKMENLPQSSQGSSPLYNPSSQQSVLMQASQLYSQNVDDNNDMSGIDLEHSSLLDVMSELCVTRGLRFTERTHARGDRNRKTLIYPKEVALRKKALIIADVARPFFALVLAVPYHLTLNERNKKEKEKMWKTLEPDKEVESFMEVLVCTLDFIPFRITVRGKPIPLSNTQVVLAQIERDEAAGGESEQAGIETKNEAPRKRQRDSEETSNEKMTHTDSTSGKYASTDEDRFFYTFNGKKYMKFGNAPIFTEQDQVEQDPFLQIPQSKIVSRSKKPWTDRIRGMVRTKIRRNRLK